MKKIEINKQLLPMKAHYFLWNAGTGPVTPYMSSYARQLGFSSVIVGFIYTILPISGMLAKPFFGSIADRFRCQKFLFLAAQLLTAAAFLGVLYSPKVDVSRQVQLSCYKNVPVLSTNSTISKCSIDEIKKVQSWGTCKLSCGISDSTANILCISWKLSEFCESNYSKTLSFTADIAKQDTELVDSSVKLKVNNITLDNRTFTPPCTPNPFISTCNVDCNDSQINNMIPEPAIDDTEVYGLYQFWNLLILMVLGWIGQAIAVSVGDAICFELLGDKPSRYGYQRMFGSLGWGIVAALAGVLIDASSEGNSQKNYAVAFYMGAGFLVLDFVASLQVKYTQKKVSANICRDVGLLLLNVRVIIFLIWCIGVGMCTGLIWQFLFWLIEDLAGANGCSGLTYVKTLEGLVQGCQSIFGETPFFFISGRIIKKLGHVHTMSLVLCAIGVRFCLYSVITNPWYFLPIELSNGLTFGLFFACMASYASIIAPSGTEATMQGLVGAVFEGVGVSAGSSLAGTLYQKYGGALTFRFFGIGALILCVIHIGVQYLLRGPQINYITPNETLKKINDDDEKELTYLYS